jgi:hypothetical protein
MKFQLSKNKKKFFIKNLRLLIGLASFGAFPIPKLGLISSSPKLVKNIYYYHFHHLEILIFVDSKSNSYQNLIYEFH